MNILVFGLGALGTVYSCLLKKAGHYVCGIDFPSTVKAINKNGVEITGIWGNHKAQLDELATDVTQLDLSHYDLIILTVKSYETANVVKQIQDRISPKTYLLLAQNGYGNFEAATNYIASDKVILARVIFGAVTKNAGLSEVTVIADDVVIGSPIRAIKEEFLNDLANIFSVAGIPTRTSNNVMKYIWGKIIYNSALNPLGAILEVSYGTLAQDINCRNIMNSIIKEIFAVLKELKQDTLWSDAAAYLQDFYSKMVPSTSLHFASMLQDIQSKRPTEIDYLNGAVIQLGQEQGVPTPVNETIYNLLKAKEKLRILS